MDRFFYIFSTVYILILHKGRPMSDGTNSGVQNETQRTTSTPATISTKNQTSTTAKNTANESSTTMSARNITTQNMNTTEMRDSDNFLVYILVPATILALVGFVLLTVLIIRCFRAVHTPEDVAHLTGKDDNENAEHHSLSIFNKSYNGIDPDDQSSTKNNPRKRSIFDLIDHSSTNNNQRKKSIFELTESHAIQRPDPAYIDIDIPIDMPSPEEENVLERSNDNNTEKGNTTNRHTKEISEFSAVNQNYNHIEFKEDEEGLYNRLTLKNTNQRATQIIKSTFDDTEYDHSAVTKSYKTFEDSYSRLSNVVPRKNPFLRLSEDLEEKARTSAQTGVRTTMLNSSKAFHGVGKQTDKSDRLAYNYSKVKKNKTADVKQETKEATEDVIKMTKVSEQSTEICSEKSSNDNNKFVISPNCSQSTDKYGYSIVNKRKCIHPEIQPGVRKEEKTEIQAETKNDEKKKKSRKEADYSDVIFKSNIIDEDFHFDGTEINTDKFFIMTDS